jgi:pilus assembly protein CpaE
MQIATQITTSIDIAASTNSGVPILTSTPNHPSSAAIRKLAALFTGEPAGAAEPGRHADVDKDRSSRIFRIRR